MKGPCVDGAGHGGKGPPRHRREQSSWAPANIGKGGNNVKALERIMAEALALEDKERGLLTARLLDSMDEGRDQDTDTAWEAEVERRIDDLDANPSHTVSWDHVKARLAGNQEQPSR